MDLSPSLSRFLKQVDGNLNVVRIAAVRGDYPARAILKFVSYEIVDTLPDTVTRVTRVISPLVCGHRSPLA